MALAYSAIRSEVRSNIRRAATAFSDARLNYTINWAQRMIANEHHWEEMRVSLNDTAIEDCEDAWTASTNVTCTADSDNEQRGTYCAKMAIAAGFSTGLAAYEDVSALDFTDYTHVRFEVMSDVATAAGDLQFLLDDTAGCGSALESLNIGALTADTWATQNLKLSAPSSASAVLSMGLNVVTDNGAQNVYLDDVRRFRGTEKDVRQYSFPTRMQDIYDISLQDGTSSRQLIYVPARHFDDMIPRARETTSGVPTHYVDHGSYFELWPIPDDVYPLFMRYTRFPVDLSSDTDTSALDNKDHLIIALSTAMCLDEIMEDEQAVRWSQIYKRRLGNAKLADHSHEDWRPRARPFNRAGQHYFGDPSTNPFLFRGEL